jgi:phosphoribosylaminoimidazole (AIR) synthetase
MRIRLVQKTLVRQLILSGLSLSVAAYNTSICSGESSKFKHIILGNKFDCEGYMFDIQFTEGGEALLVYAAAADQDEVIARVAAANLHWNGNSVSFTVRSTSFKLYAKDYLLADITESAADGDHLRGVVCSVED